MFGNNNNDRTSFFSSGNKLNYRQSNGSIILKMIVTQVVIIVFSLTVQAALGMAGEESKILLLFGSIASIVFYMCLLYTTCWEVGMSECVSVETGKSEYKPFRIIPLALIANALNILLAITTVVGFIFNNFSYDETVRWAYSVYGVSNNILRVLESMYAGTLYYFGIHQIPYILILLVVPQIIFSEFGYYMGLKGKTIRSFFGIKTKYDSEEKKDK